jgi:DcuC family C4-dicarboxylate transporter
MTNTPVVVLDLILVVVLVWRRVDVRLVLLVGAVPLFVTADGLSSMLVKIAHEMSDPATVVPICAAIGFAFVLRLTGCDQELVRLLLRPLQTVRVLLIPGGIAAGYLINTTIVSQTGTAAVLGPVLLPLLRAAGLGPITSGAILLQGSSMGGELFNQGAVEVRKLAELTGRSSSQVIAQSKWLNLLSAAAALVAFWLLALRRQRRLTSTRTSLVNSDEEPTSTERRPINLIKAVVPVLPIVLLALDAQVGPNPVTRALPGPSRILAAMLIGVVAAGLTSLENTAELASAFFEGAGYAYTHVISLIVAASTFAEGIRQSGLIGLLIRALVPWPAMALVVAMGSAWCLAFVAGTGIAPAVAIMEFFVPAAGSMGIDPTQLGAITAIGAHFGRTMSPAAAVVALSARLSDSQPSDLIRRVAIPLLAGGVAVLLAALLFARG